MHYWNAGIGERREDACTKAQVISASYEELERQYGYVPI